MAIMAMGTVNRKFVFCGLMMSSASALAGDLQITPQLLVEGNYTDNVGLVSSNEDSSFVNQLGVNFDIAYYSQHAEFEFNSSNIYATYSHDHDLDDDYLTLNTSGRFLLWPNGIALTASATVENQSRNRARNALADLVSADTVQVENYSAGVEYAIENSDFLLNFDTSYKIRKAEDGIGERDGLTAQLSTTSGKASRKMFWSLNTNYIDYENDDADSNQTVADVKLGLITPYKINPFVRYFYEDNSGQIANRQTFESNSYGLGLRWLVNPRLFLDVSYNRPESDQLDLDGNTQEDYVNASVSWQPTARTQVEADYGERFYGESYGLNITHRNRRLTNKITYNEKVESFTRNNYQLTPQGAFWCPLEFTLASECYVQPGSDFNFDDFRLITLNEYELLEDNTFSLNKVASWNSTLSLARTTFSLQLSHGDKESLETRISDKSERASFSISRKVSGYSTVDFNIEFNEENFNIDTDNERLDRYRRYSATYNRKLNASFNAKLGLTHINRQSNEASFNYKESRVYISVVKDF